MKRNYPQRISQVIENLLREQNMEETLRQHRALAAWPRVVGTLINRQTVERRVGSGILYVRIASAVIRQELTLHRADLIKALNEAAGAEVINEIKFM